MHRNCVLIRFAFFPFDVKCIASHALAHASAFVAIASDIVRYFSCDFSSSEISYIFIASHFALVRWNGDAILLPTLHNCLWLPVSMHLSLWRAARARHDWFECMWVCLWMKWRNKNKMHFCFRCGRFTQKRFIDASIPFGVWPRP